MTKSPSILYFLSILPFFFYSVLNGNTGGVSGSNLFEVTSDGNTTTYKIVSASITGDPIFTGTVDSVSDTNITFATSLDENNATVYPFFAAGSFNKDVQVPKLTASLSGVVVDSISIAYATPFDSSLGVFTNPPEIIISPSDNGGDTAEATATISAAGDINGTTIDVDGNYTSAPTVTVVAGPHFVRIIDTESNYYGRVFLIENNSQTSLKLDFSTATVVNGEDANASTFFSDDTLVEVCPAATLGSIFGYGTTLLSGLESGASWDNANAADWIYLYTEGSGYSRYFHVDFTGHRFLSSKTGWYTQGSSTLKNNAVIYPDEAFIIAKRKSGTVELDIEVSQLDSPARIYLPERGDIFVANNPYGMDMLLTELIPSTAIGTGTNQFKPGANDSDTEMDTITILDSSGSWKTYYYINGDNDGGITELMIAEAKAGTGVSNALTSSDLSISNGTITALTSWENSSSAGSVTGNDGNYTFIETSSPPSAGFKVTISGLEGYLLNSDGTSEMNATTEEDVAGGSGTQVLSALNGTHEVVFANGSGFVVEKQMDVNHTNDAAHLSLPGSWNVGDLGTGYDGTAYWWAVGGNGTGASGTVTTGGSFTVTSEGSGYTSAPQIVVSGGGWREISAAASPQGGQVIGSDDGIIIHRKHSTGVSAFIELPNITD
jgi:hypothetical protein